MKFEKEFNECKRYGNLQMSATRFMNCAERFGNLQSIASFSSTQMIALLSLPDAEETEKFIAEMIQNILRAVDRFLDEHGYTMLKHHMFNVSDPELTDELNEQMMMEARAPMTEITRVKK